jgi:hypothetical protein
MSHCDSDLGDTANFSICLEYQIEVFSSFHRNFRSICVSDFFYQTLLQQAMKEILFDAAFAYQSVIWRVTG